MALNIKDPETERLASEIAALTGESKTGAVRTALRERKERLRYGVTTEDRRREFWRWLDEEFWPSQPPEKRSAPSQEEQDEIVGYDESGVW